MLKRPHNWEHWQPQRIGKKINALGKFETGNDNLGKWFEFLVIWQLPNALLVCYSLTLLPVFLVWDPQQSSVHTHTYTVTILHAEKLLYTKSLISHLKKKWKQWLSWEKQRVKRTKIFILCKSANEFWYLISSIFF